MLTRIRRSPDVLPVLILIALWLLFFWRIWTPLDQDRLSFVEGDFAGQFVSWTHYAADRLHAGEIPLWNPYQYGGTPFQADPQVALTYPPHTITLAILATQASLEPWQAYRAMQWEALLHVLLASIFTYIFTRNLLQLFYSGFRNHDAVLGGLVAAITYAYGGYLSGYPPLQIPLLEAGIWLPLVLLGILKGTRAGYKPPLIKWNWIMFAGVMLGMCFLAGHPQTGFFTVYMAIAFLAYRLGVKNWRTWLKAVIVLGMISGGIAAVQLLPALEFTQHTFRADLTFEDKGGGYTFEELNGILFPIRQKIWNPLYFGLVPLILAGIAIWRRVLGWGFFAGTAAIALILSFGARTFLYSLFYVLVPGMTLFRGQERATFIIAYCLAFLAGLGTAALINRVSTAADTIDGVPTSASLVGTPSMVSDNSNEKKLKHAIGKLLAFCLAFALILFLLAQTDLRTPAITDRLESAAFTTLILAASWWGITWFLQQPRNLIRQIALIGLLAFDLFSANTMLKQNYEPIPVSARLNFPDYVEIMHQPLTNGDRVEGLRGYGVGQSTAYRLPDIYGSNPLQLESLEFYLQQIPLERRWELLAVRVVNSEWQELPVPAQIIGQGQDGRGEFNVWELENPRGFARLVYNVWIVNSIPEAQGLVKEPSFDLRNIVVLEKNPDHMDNISTDDLPDQVIINHFAPEKIEITVENSQPAILSLALPYYPGWQATVDGRETEILRAYGGLSAISMSPGQHTVSLTFRSRLLPLSALISLVSWIGVIIGVFIFKRRSHHA